MNNLLWAPWRIGYVTKKKSGGCVFCRIKKDHSDTRNRIVYRSRHCFVVLNTYPYNNGHLMVVANRHTPSFDALTDTQVTDMMATAKKMMRILRKVLRPHGFNMGMNIGKTSGAGIAEHLHMHIVPRWEADTNFMSTVADTKIISQSLDELFALLSKHIEKI